VLTFATHDLPIDLPRIGQFRSRGERDREYFLPELLRIGWSKDSTQAARYQSIASLNYRLVEVAMMFLLPLLAVSLAVPPKRSSSSLLRAHSRGSFSRLVFESDHCLGLGHADRY
jgi:lipopolysaccharide export system permease protein